MAQTLAPIATVANTGWSTIGAATPHEAIDEGVDTADDLASYVRAVVGSPVPSLELSLGAALPPGTLGLADGTLRLRGSTSLTTRQVSVEVRAGPALLGTLRFDLGGTWANAQKTFPLANPAADWSDIRVRLFTSTGFDAVQRRVTAIEVLLPDPIVPVAIDRQLAPFLLEVPETAGIEHADRVGVGLSNGEASRNRAARCTAEARSSGAGLQTSGSRVRGNGHSAGARSSSASSGRASVAHSRGRTARTVHAIDRSVGQSEAEASEVS